MKSEKNERSAVRFSVFIGTYPVFLRKAFIAPAYVVKSALENDIEYVVVAVREHICNIAKTKVVYILGKGNTVIFFYASCYVLTAFSAETVNT